MVPWLSQASCIWIESWLDFIYLQLESGASPVIQIEIAVRQIILGTNFLFFFLIIFRFFQVLWNDGWCLKNPVLNDPKSANSLDMNCGVFEYTVAYTRHRPDDWCSSSCFACSALLTDKKYGDRKWLWKYTMALVKLVYFTLERMQYIYIWHTCFNLHVNGQKCVENTMI